MKMSVFSLILSFSLPALLTGCQTETPVDPHGLEDSSSPVYISEYRVPDGWLEICNPTDSTVSLTGYSLFVGNKKQSLDHAAMAPNEYRLVSALKGMDEADFIFLTDGQGALVDIIDNPVSKKHKSIVRSIDRVGTVTAHAEDDITPGFPNNDAGRRAYQATRRRPNATGVVFSEILASGETDFIEVHNPTGQPVDLSGFGLSDKENFALFQFPKETVLEPDGYLAVFCSAEFKKAEPDSAGFRAPFSLKNGEDFVYLSDPDGNIVLEYGPVSMPKGESLASINGYPFIPTRILTPGQPNEMEGNAPAASVGSGQYDGIDTLKVELFAKGVIRYTMDGSVPGTGSKKYEKPFRLTKTAVIRAVSVLSDGSLSPVSSFTYIINEGHKLDVVSLVSEPSGLFSTGSGIYSTGPYRLKPHGTEDDGKPGINYPYTQANFWRKWWRRGNVSLLPREGAGFSIDCGVSIFGGYSRIHPKKSMKFKFKSTYGPSKLHYKLFPERDFSEYKSFVVRTGGQDIYGTLIKDDLASYLANGLVDVMATRPAVFYINGQYYGFYCIREKINKNFVASHYNIPNDSMDIIMGNSNVEEGSGKDWSAMLSYIRSHDLSNPEYYKYVTDRIDIQSFTDWVIAETWIGNQDAGNVRIFRSPYLDGKWHWILYDVDMGLTHPTSDSFMIYYKPAEKRLHQTDVIRGLLKNPEYREFFVYRLEYQMSSIWNKDRVNAAIDHFVEMIDSEVPRNNKRWQGTYQGWQSKIKGLHTFADGRQAYLKRMFATDPLLKKIVHLTPEELDRCFGY